MAAQMSAQLQCTCNFDQKRLTFEAWQCKSVWMSAVQAISQAQPVAPAHGSGTRPSIIQGISCLEAQVCSDLLEQSTTAAGLLQLETSHACSTNAICQAAQGSGMRQSGTGSAYQPGLSILPWFNDECRQLRRHLRAAA